ncbi:MAG: TetR/AcrR family transcriptional regulator [Hyphomonadaceae bacterium]
MARSTPPSPPNDDGGSPETDGPETEREDGRRRRSNRSRVQIVEAMLHLIRSGDMMPSAAEVADAAGVSIRTVFRHFEDMDSLYREMSARVEAEIMPMVREPFGGATWLDQLDELLARRAHIYERIMPIRTAASLRRFRSAFLMEEYRRFLQIEREGLESVLPKSIRADRLTMSGLEVTISFQAWRRMRQDQGLSAKDAEAVMRRIVDLLIAPART